MKNKKSYLLILLILLVLGYLQSTLYSPLTPKAAAIAHFKINPKLIPSPKANSTGLPSNVVLAEAEIKAKHGRLELIRLINDELIRGVVIEQGDSFIRAETTKGILKISTDQIDTVEIMR